jgi:hypothetical protein
MDEDFYLHTSELRDGMETMEGGEDGDAYVGEYVVGTEGVLEQRRLLIGEPELLPRACAGAVAGDRTAVRRLATILVGRDDLDCGEVSTGSGRDVAPSTKREERSRKDLETDR